MEGSRGATRQSHGVRGEPSEQPEVASDEVVQVSRATVHQRVADDVDALLTHGPIAVRGGPRAIHALHVLATAGVAVLELGSLGMRAAPAEPPVATAVALAFASILVIVRHPRRPTSNHLPVHVDVVEDRQGKVLGEAQGGSRVRSFIEHDPDALDPCP